MTNIRKNATYRETVSYVLKVLLIKIYKLNSPVVSILIVLHERLYELLQFLELHSTLFEKRFSSQVFPF